MSSTVPSMFNVLKTVPLTCAAARSVTRIAAHSEGNFLLEKSVSLITEITSRIVVLSQSYHATIRNLP